MACCLELKFAPLRLDLHQQAFAQASRGHAYRIEILHQVHCLSQQRGGGTRHGGGSRIKLTHKARQQFLISGHEVAILIQVAHHIFSGVAQVAAQIQRTQLPKKR